jgi:hypothetical protein
MRQTSERPGRASPGRPDGQEPDGADAPRAGRPGTLWREIVIFVVMVAVAFGLVAIRNFNIVSGP